MKFNYKKSLLSVAAATAIAVSSLNAGYIPLSDDAGHDEQWTLFGVTGLQASGAGAGTSAGTFSISDNVANTITDETLDDLYVEGLIASTGESLGKVKVLSPYSTIEVRVDTAGAVFNSTEPVRTMYVKMTEGGGAAFALTYRASLEGRTLQYSITNDGSDAHTIVINSDYTYNNPGLGQVIQEIAGIPSAILSKLSDMVDYNLSNNPSNSAYYDKDVSQDKADANESLRVYSYDTATEIWKLYDSRNAVEANDFLELQKGKAYWAKMRNENANGGLVLGSSSVSATDYTTAGITDGWNLLSFDNENPDIRKSDTGLILTLNGEDSIKIYDASGNHSISVDVNNSSTTTTNTSCKNINDSIKQAKLLGSLPDTFDLKAFLVTDKDHIVLISNKRFMVEDTNDGAVGAVTTLTGANPYVLDITDLVNIDDSAAVDDLGDGSDVFNSAVMSKYGEYAMIIEPLVGDADNDHPWDTAASIGNDADAGSAKIHIQSAASDATTVAALDIDDSDVVATALTDTTTNLGNGTTGVDIGGYKVHAFEMDINYDDTTDRILLASPQPFYVRDYTFTRSFKYTDDTANAGDISIAGTGKDDTYTTTAGAQGADDIASDITTNDNNTFATENDSNDSIIFISSAENANEFTVTENTSSTVDVDQLEDAVINADITKGAIKGVYSLGAFAQSDTHNVVTFSLDTPDDENDTLRVDLKNTIGNTYTGTETTISDVPADDNAWATTFKKQLERELSTANITSNVTAIDGGSNDINVTITSTDILDIAAIWTDNGGNSEDNVTFGTATVAKGELETVSPDLASDLKFNAVYTPNYVIDGPLYTMKSAGFTLKALVSGTTDLTDGSVNWDSVDLTRTPSEWLDSQDYNLFEVDEKAGYWAFLEADGGANPITVSNADLKPVTYTYRFNKNGTNYNSISGNIALTIDGLDTDSRAVPVVSATIAGSVVELANIDGSNIYTGKVSSYEIENITDGYNYEILVNAADGLGYHIKSTNVNLNIDYEKPTAPVINLGDGTTVALTSSADAAGYYIFNGQIPEEGTSGAVNLLSKLTAAEAAAYGLCQATNKLAWDDDAYNLNIIAVDGTGVLGKGNVSNTTRKPYVPMLKSAVRLIDTANSDTDATAIGTVYDDLCANAGAQTVNYGVTLTSMTDLQTVKMAYEPQNVTDTTATPISLFVNSTAGDDSIIAKITYADVYAGERIYVQLENRVYSLLLPTADEIAGDEYTGQDMGTSTDDPLDLNSNVAAPNNVKATYYAEQSL